MKKYIGKKQIEAQPMTLGDFVQKIGRNPYGKDIEKHEESEQGYYVRYEDGYESWSPKDVFEKAYQVADTFLDRLQIEQQDLAEKLSKLCAFVDTPKFEEVVKEERQRDLLLQQRDFMGEYLDILNQRIEALK